MQRFAALATPPNTRLTAAAIGASRRLVLPPTATATALARFCLLERLDAAPVACAASASISGIGASSVTAASAFGCPERFRGFSEGSWSGVKGEATGLSPGDCAESSPADKTAGFSPESAAEGPVVAEEERENHFCHGFFMLFALSIFSFVLCVDRRGPLLHFYAILCENKLISSVGCRFDFNDINKIAALSIVGSAKPAFCSFCGISAPGFTTIFFPHC